MPRGDVPEGGGAPLRNPPRPTPPRPHVGTGGAATRGRWKPQPCTSSTSLALGRVALQLHVSPAWKLTPKFGHLCCRGVRGCTASDPSRSSAFHLDAGTCPLLRTAINYFYFYFPPPVSSFSTQAQPPPVLSFLHSFPSFLIHRASTSRNGCRGRELLGEHPAPPGPRRSPFRGTRAAHGNNLLPAPRFA